MKRTLITANLGACLLISMPLHAAPFYAQQTVQGATGNTVVVVPDGVDPKNFAVAREIVKSFDMSNIMQGVFDVMSKTMLPLIARDNPGSTQQVQQMQQVAMQAVQKTFASHMDELENNKAIVYAQMYTYDELQQLKTFYQSPVGQKMMKTMPQMLQKGMALDQHIMIQAMDETKRSIIDALKKNGMRVPKEMDL